MPCSKTMKRARPSSNCGRSLKPRVRPPMPLWPKRGKAAQPNAAACWNSPTRSKSCAANWPGCADRTSNSRARSPSCSASRRMRRSGSTNACARWSRCGCLWMAWSSRRHRRKSAISMRPWKCCAAPTSCGHRRPTQPSCAVIRTAATPRRRCTGWAMRSTRTGPTRTPSTATAVWCRSTPHTCVRPKPCWPWPTARSK
ncbi:hypothetical protein FQZ97_1010500 [compost metagenome]